MGKRQSHQLYLSLIWPFYSFSHIRAQLWSTAVTKTPSKLSKSQKHLHFSTVRSETLKNPKTKKGPETHSRVRDIQCLHFPPLRHLCQPGPSKPCTPFRPHQKLHYGPNPQFFCAFWKLLYSSDYPETHKDLPASVSTVLCVPLHPVYFL